jgi:hypothetical protein
MTQCANCGNDMGEKARCEECLQFDVDRLNSILDSYYAESELSRESSDLYVGKEKYRKNMKSIIPKLEHTAINKEKTTYSEVSDDLYRRGRYLAAAGAVEYHDDRPLLPSVVVRVEDGKKTFPNDGYFIMAQNLGLAPKNLVDSDEETKRDWWKPRFEEVHSWWGSRDYTPPESY